MSRPTPPLALVAALVLAGCTGGAGHAHEGLDTGLVAPGAEAALRFDHAGTYALHCHPHPAMTMQATVEEDAPATAHVHVHDDGYEPALVRVRPGGSVVFHNHGSVEHTATERG